MERSLEPSRAAPADGHAPPRQTQKTYWHLLAARRMPSEYDLLTSQLDYRASQGLSVQTPLSRWSEAQQREPRLRVADWEAFADPRETTYGSFLELKQRQSVLFEALDGGDLEDGHGRHPDLRELWTNVLAPQRFVRHGLQMLAAYLGAAAPCGRVAVAAAFQAADELQQVHRLSYLLHRWRARDSTLGADARQRFTADPAWQGVRKAIERLLVTYDWPSAFCALNLVIKPALDDLLLAEGAGVARQLGSDELARTLAAFADSGAWQRDWSRALVAMVVGQGADNRELLARRVAEADPLLQDVLSSVATGLWPSSVDGDAIAERVRAATARRLERLELA